MGSSLAWGHRGNSLKEIIAEMSRHGFAPPELILDGKIHRFGDKKKSNWFIGFSNYARATGQPLVIVQYGSWKTGETYTYNSNADFTAEDKKFLKLKIDEAKRKADQEKLHLQGEVADDQQSFFEQLSELEITTYMQRKKIPRHFGSRAQFGNLYVPMRDIDGKLWGIQTVTEIGSKFFAEGQRVSGTFHTIGDITNAETIYICEGFATGASIYQAINRAVVIAFNAGNLLPVCEILKGRFPEKKFIVCGDDDLWTTRKSNGVDEPWNPGRELAIAAAKRIMAHAIFPVFRDTSLKPTDFNDLHLIDGLDTVKNQIEPVKGQRHFVAPLGFVEKEYFFTSTNNQQVVPVRAFTEVDFLNLMPREYWEQVYPGQRGQNIDWNRARSELMATARRKGIFNPLKVRGSGVWQDEGRIVVNQGDHLLVDGSCFGLSDFKSQYFYALGRALPKLADEPLEANECDLLVEICETFKWRKPDFGKMMAGYLVISKICGALEIRPHIWLTGGSQTGKTTLLQRLIAPTLKGYSLYFLGGTTEAGLRQSLRNDSVPVIFDEFETNSPRSAENIQACIELMRSAWSETHGGIAKGSSGGSALFYHPRFSAIVSSIRPSLINDADRSRFTIMELAPHGSDPEHWKYLKNLLSMFDQKFISRLFVRTLGLIPVLNKNFQTIRAALSAKVGSRFGEQHGMLLAGYWLLKSDSPITDREAEILVGGLELEHEQVDAKVTDEMECLTHLLTTKLRLTVGKDFVEKPLNSVVDMILNGSPMDPVGAYQAAVEAYGIKIDNLGINVAFSNSELRSKIFKDTRWVHCWSASLLRMPGTKRVTARSGQRTFKSVFIPMGVVTSFVT